MGHLAFGADEEPHHALCTAVCVGQIALAATQHAIVTDVTTVLTTRHLGTEELVQG
ncbi:hypothetical protein AB0D86_40850 [Streptomyces sp. NPDC048324]|uniref:hypothetical protein n=1 Tax=Streptomyces sp. NPDC048324 TaxID=3157205 RepID=UPI00341AA85E